jgi:hypothetical protein
MVDSHVLHYRSKQRWLRYLRLTLVHHGLIGHALMVLVIESLPVNHPLALIHGLMRIFLRIVPLLALLIQLILVLLQTFLHMLYFLVLCEAILLS